MDVLEHMETNEHAEFVLGGLNRFRHTDPTFCDFSLSVSDCNFPCHRSVLCLFSSFFRAAIRGGYKELHEQCVNLKVSELYALHVTTVVFW